MIPNLPSTPLPGAAPAFAGEAGRLKGRYKGRNKAGAIRRLVRVAMLAATITSASVLTGCASYLSAQVTSFHQMAGGDQRFARQPFVIEPTPEQRDSLEFRAYADLVRQALVRQGMVDAGGTGAGAVSGAGAGAGAALGATAPLAVSLRYSVDAGRAVVYSYPTYGYGFGPVYGWAPYYARGGRVHYALTATYPVGYGMISPSYYGQSTVYRRELRVDIVDRRAGANGAKLFEGSAVSEGESASLAPVMPAMVRALFSDFPGANGVTRRVQVRLDDAPGVSG
jgi:hypothetical protein